MDFEEDDELAKAIALSLQETKKHEVINVDSDDDEEEEDNEDARFQADIKRALEASQLEASRTQSSRQSSESRSVSVSLVPGSSSKAPADVIRPSPGASAFLSERAQLERERRERQKRMRKEAGLDDDEERETEEPQVKRQHLSSSSRQNNNSQHAGSSKIPAATVPTDEQIFWDGEFRQTATQHAEPRKDGKPTFRLTDVLGKRSDLVFAIMSSYSLDFPWIYDFFDRSVPVIMVAQPDPSGSASVKNVLPNWIKATPQLRAGFGCQHMKFMLLFHKTGRLRVVISTANLIAYDWRDMENSVWLQDIPLRSSSNPLDSKVTDDFPSILQHMLYSLNLKTALAAMIMDNHPNLPITAIEDIRRRWDWSKVKALLVPSIAGKHEGWPAVIKTGHPRLMVAVRKLGLRTGKGKSKKELVLECQGSSLGTYTTQWMNEFHYSARGESAEDWLNESKKSREKLPYPPIRVVFPTKKTVQESVHGEKGGGTIFCRRKQWIRKNFPRDRFYDSKSKAGPVLMHSKMIIAISKDRVLDPQDSETEEESDSDIEVIEPAIGWAYVGSHNFTPSAWGTLSGSAFNPILNISNYEVGVVFPLKDQAEANNFACFQRPPKKYISGEDEPWIQEESVYHQDQ